jgi:hypothetical protein
MEGLPEKKEKQMRRTIMLLASMAVVLVLASGAAFALANLAIGGSIERVSIKTEKEASGGNDTSFVDIPGATVFVPSGSSRLIMARYSAESVCSGGSGNAYCSVKIVARNETTGAITELGPTSDGGFAFDSTDGGRETSVSWESHSMDRSVRLGEGSYFITAQRRSVPGPGTTTPPTFRLDDWSFTVEQAQ